MRASCDEREKENMREADRFLEYETEQLLRFGRACRPQSEKSRDRWSFFIKRANMVFIFNVSVYSRLFINGMHIYT